MGEDVQICPRCDHIIDPSFLGEIPEGAGGDRTPPDGHPAADQPSEPMEVLRRLLDAVMHLSFEDKIECLSCAAMLLMAFMPWRTTQGDDDLGLFTWGGFWSAALAAGVLWLFSLRQSRRQSGRVPDLAPKTLCLGELVLGSVTLPLTLAFAFSSVDRRQTQVGSLVTYASMPSFGSVLGILCAAGICLGAALACQRAARG